MASDCRSAQLSSIVGATAGGLPPQVAGGRWPVAGRLPPLTPLTPPPLPLPHAVARAFPGTGLEEGVKDRHSALGTRPFLPSARRPEYLNSAGRAASVSRRGCCTLATAEIRAVMSERSWMFSSYS